MAKSVTVIPQTRNRYTAQSIAMPLKRRVAGYARVSTDSDEQFTSYEAQVNYYTQFILSNPEWEFVKVYTDEGITGTNTRHRDGFNEMVADALDGKIDLIVTKSVSRFARNTVDSLVTIRKLKEHGCECFFEKENIYTFDGKGELLLTIMSSLAQEESRSISENVTWGQRKRFADGKVSMPYKQFLGYEKGEDATPVINEEQAKVVHRIYQLFMEGKTPFAIAHELTSQHIPTPSGKEKWQPSTVSSILSNEKYKGDALLQKCFTVDFLTKKQKVNEGEVPQYYVTGSHPAIIDPDEFEMVQVEIKRRKKAGKSYSGNSAMASKIVCGDCGSFYGQKIWHSNSAYRTIIYRCNRKYDQMNKCQTPAVREEVIRQSFLLAYSRFMNNRDRVIKDCEQMRGLFQDDSALQEQIAHYQEEMELMVERNRKLIKKRAASMIQEAEFAAKSEQMNERYQASLDQYNLLTSKLEENRKVVKEMTVFIQNLKNQPMILEKWDDQIWSFLVKKVVVQRNGDLNFIFNNGEAVTINKQ